MKKIALAALATAAAFAASPAAAQTTGVTGTVNVTGNVQQRCSVIQSGSEVQTFSGNIALGRLDAADGTLRQNLVGSTTASPADGLKVSARVVCTTGNPTLGILAGTLNNGVTATPAAGYSNVINYTASMKVTAASGAQTDLQFKTDTDTTEKTARLGGRIAGGTANNVEVSIFGLKTRNGSDVLEAGDYTSTVAVTILPTI